MIQLVLYFSPGILSDLHLNTGPFTNQPVGWFESPIPAKAPSILGPEWKLANLQPVQSFLREQRDKGNYIPAIPLGLD